MVVKRTKGAYRGQITLRVPPDVHKDLAEVAEGLGLDINGLLNLMIRRHFDRYRLEVEVLQAQAKENRKVLAAWQEKNPKRPIREFWSDFQAFEAAKRAYASRPLLWRDWLDQGHFDFDREDAAGDAGRSQRSQ
jgi:antitoxin component of RelBE/YafQ-DinJ toxin-antitoxin module